MLMQGPKPALSEWLPIDHLLKTSIPAEAPAALLDLWSWILAATQSYYYVDRKEYFDLLAKLPHELALLSKWERVCHELNRHGLGFAEELLTAGQKHFSDPPTTPSVTP